MHSHLLRKPSVAMGERVKAGKTVIGTTPIGRDAVGFYPHFEVRIFKPRSHRGQEGELVEKALYDTQVQVRKQWLSPEEMTE